MACRELSTDKRLQFCCGEVPAPTCKIAYRRATANEHPETFGDCDKQFTDFHSAKRLRSATRFQQFCDVLFDKSGDVVAMNRVSFPRETGSGELERKSAA